MEREVGQKLALERGCCGRFLLMVGHDAAGIVFFFFFAEADGPIIEYLYSGGCYFRRRRYSRGRHRRPD